VRIIEELRKPKLTAWNCEEMDNNIHVGIFRVTLQLATKN
jgi:hypothetical protein